MAAMAGRIKSDQDYIDYANEHGILEANNEAATSWFDVSPNVIAKVANGLGGSMRRGSGPGGARMASDDSSYYTDGKGVGRFALNEGGNRMTNDNPWMSMKGAFGDNASTGWFGPAVTGVNAVAKTVLGYQELQATKKNNEEKIALMKEANFMKKLKMKNQVNQANRYSMLAMGNSNSQSATMSAVNRTPYTSMGLA